MIFNIAVVFLVWCFVLYYQQKIQVFLFCRTYAILWTLESMKRFCNFLNFFLRFLETYHISWHPVKKGHILSVHFQIFCIANLWFFFMVINWRQSGVALRMASGCNFHLSHRVGVIVMEKIGKKQFCGIILFPIF